MSQAGSKASMIVDIVDDDNNPIGLAHRSDVLAKGYGFRTVHVFLFDDSGRLFLQRLRHDHPRSPGKLGSSAAGYLYAGETYVEAAYRKILEELNVTTLLWYNGMWSMKDENSRKFVSLFSGAVSEPPLFNPTEVLQTVSMTVDEVDNEVKRHPSRFTDTFTFLWSRFNHDGRRAET